MNTCAYCAHCKKAEEKRNATVPSTSWRRFEYEDAWANSSKFWSIRMDYDPTIVWIRYGKIGTKGTLIKKDFNWTYESREFYTRMVKEKLGKGYEFAGSGTW